MLPETMTVLDTNFKDDSPLNTVERIREILRSYGISTEESWSESGVPHCYSLRVSVSGTEFGTNGKGVTRELALASAYGELAERLQFGRNLQTNNQKDGSLYANDPKGIYLSAQELLSRNRQWYSRYVKDLEALTGKKLTEEELLQQYCDEQGNIPVTPFYCVNKHSHEYLPTELVNTVYGTNGCAAGNTVEEALVQAISEIVERNFCERILLQEIAVPDIPEEVLRSCTVAYEIITFLRSQNFRVIVKDCSLGTKFPVVCVWLINQDTGRYHTHFGAYPNFEIALQRTLTETFQGRSLQQIAKFVDFTRRKAEGFDLGKRVEQLVWGTVERSPEFFVDATADYVEHKKFSGKNNRELLKECVEFLSQQGYDVLVHDYSCLGFPTYQVIVPGYSESLTYRMDPKQSDTRYRRYTERVLRDPSAATMEELMGFMMSLNQGRNAKTAPQTFSAQANLPARLSQSQERYFLNAAMAHITYTLGRNAETVVCIDKMLSEGVEKDEEHLICIKRYLSLRADRYDESSIRAILEYFHEPETVRRLYAAISEKKNLLDPFVVRCDMRCDDSCLIRGTCRRKQTEALSQLIHRKNQELDNAKLEEQLSAIL